MSGKSGVRFADFIRNPELEVESGTEGVRGYMFQGRDGSQVVFWECDIQLESPPDKHPFDEYGLVVEGIGRETRESNRKPQTKVLRKGDESLIPAGTVHSAVDGPNYRAIDVFGSPRCRYRNS